MAKYVLADLMRMRVMRKDRAERELMKAKQLVVQAKEMVAQREKELQEYEIWVEKEIDRQYNEILKQQIRRGAIDDLGENIKILRAKTLDYVKRISDAKENLRKAEENVVQKHDALMEAERNLQKLDEHKKEWLEEQRVLEEFVSDMELEESVRYVPKDPDADGDSDDSNDAF